MKKHVYLFNEGSRASVYGIGTYIRQMIACLKLTPDIELHIIQLNTNIEHFEIKEEKGYDVYNCPCASVWVRDKAERYFRNICFLLRLHIPVNEHDKNYFLFNYTSHLPLVSAIKICYSGCTIFFTIHYQDWCFALNGDVSHLKKIIHTKNTETLPSSEQNVYDSYLKEKRMYQSVDKVICLSNFTRMLLQEEYGITEERTVLIYNGLKDEGKILSFKERNALKKQLHFLSKEKIILFVGRLDPIKGIKTLVMAFQYLIQENPDYRLVVIGDGDFQSCLSECGTNWNKITFTGRLEKDKLYDFYQIADVGVMPSMHEQCSYVAIEMMMFGIPMVISTTTGLKEMMPNKDFGFTFTMKNEDKTVVQELAKLISNVLTIPSEKKIKIKNLSRFYYEKAYSESKMQREYINLLISEM